MLKIYGAELSSPANKVRFVANALNLEYEYVQIRVRDGEHRKDEFLKINPVGKIPAMDDNGFTLFESGAIIRYLTTKEKSNFYPEDIQQRALVEQWMDFSTIHVNGAMGRVLFNRVFFQLAKVEKDERSLEDGIKFLARYLPVVNDRLGESKYLASDKISLADFTLLSALDPVEIAKIDVSGYEHIIRWREELQVQDFYTKCYDKYGKSIERMMAALK
jgi:glutathione S-transferase